MFKKALLYITVFAGCFFEGETSLTTSAFAAHRGYLEIFAVMLVALAATQSWDWLWFTIGRLKGKSLLSGKPEMRAKARKINILLSRYPIPVLLSYRFFYGFRTVVPLAIGMSSISKKKFLIFSLLNTMVWDILFSSLGYFFGAFLKANWEKIESYEIEIMIFIVIIGVVTGYYLMRRSKKAISRKANQISHTKQSPANHLV
jgi:membrane protein DedA with SNARE-associated domain